MEIFRKDNLLKHLSEIAGKSLEDLVGKESFEKEKLPLCMRLVFIEYPSFDRYLKGNSNDPIDLIIL